MASVAVMASSTMRLLKLRGLRKAGAAMAKKAMTAIRANGMEKSRSAGRLCMRRRVGGRCATAKRQNGELGPEELKMSGALRATEIKNEYERRKYSAEIQEGISSGWRGCGEVDHRGAWHGRSGAQ